MTKLVVLVNRMFSEVFLQILDSEKYQELIRAHEEGRFDDISYCKDCDQLWEVPESLVWTNIESRKYNTSKVIEDMKLA